MPIVLPVKPAAVEKTAANELKNYICRLTKANLSVVSEDEYGDDGIYVGATDFAAANKVSYPDNEFGEGWAIEAVGGSLVLCGGKARGALYAVYHLLEDVFGIRWWNMWEEYVPESGAALVPAGYRSGGVPAMAYRDIYVGNESTDTLFFVRNRINGFAANTPPDWGGVEDFGHPYHVHTFNRYFPPFYKDSFSGKETNEWIAMNNPEHEDYFADHPEWYAYSAAEGRRVENGQLCLCADGLYEAFSEKLLKSVAFSYAEADAAGIARPRYFDVSPNDTGGHCECVACRDSIAKHGESGHLLRFVNRLAGDAAKKYPGILLETLGYWHYVYAPTDGTVPAKNLVIRFADNYMDILHSLSHKNNADFHKRLKNWADICAEGNLYIWDYAVVYAENGVFPSMYKYGDNFKAFMESGVNGYFVEHEQCINADFWDMKLWLMAKLMEDPCRDCGALMNEFIGGYYGKAGGYIRKYLDMMHAKAEASDFHAQFGVSVIAAPWLTVEDIMAGSALFDKAFAAAEGDGELLRRLRAARSGLDRVIVNNYAKYDSEARKKNLEPGIDGKEIIDRLVKTMTEQVAMRGDYDSCGKTMLEKYKSCDPDSLPACCTG